MIIEISGIDGSGKSTLVAHLQGFFSANAVPCVERVMRSTYKRILADVSRRAGHDHWRHHFSVEEAETAHALEMCSLVATTITPLDHSYQVVVTDTYIRRWMATAHMWGADNLDRLQQIYSRLPEPDLAIHLSIDPEIAYRRLQARPKRDHLVKLGNPSRVAAYARSFGEISSMLHYEPHVLSTAASLDETVQEMLTLVREWDRNNAGLLTNVAVASGAGS